MHVEKRENPIVNRLNKTKVEKFPNLAEEKEARQKELRLRDRDAQQLRVSAIAISCSIDLDFECCSHPESLRSSLYNLRTPTDCTGADFPLAQGRSSCSEGA